MAKQRRQRMEKKKRNEPEFPPVRERIFAMVEQIPKGRVMNYGAVGAWVQPPVGARQVGWIMAQAPKGCPWWRVVGANGALPLHKSNPEAAMHQYELLSKEGVRFTSSNRVCMKLFRWEPDLD